MNKRLKRLVVATASLMLVESSPIWAVNDVYAAEESINQQQIESWGASTEEAVKRINEGTEEVADYEELGIKNVTNDNLACVRYSVQKVKLNNKKNLTKDQIKKSMETVFADIENAKTNIYLGKATLDDYKVLQILVVNSTNLEDVNKILSGSRLIAIGKIKSEAENVINNVKKINDGTAELNDYYSLNIAIQNPEYLQVINKQIKNNKDSGKLRIKDIQVIINEVNTNIKDALDRIYKGQGTLKDYSYICDLDVNENNLEDVNDWIKDSKYKNFKRLLNKVNDVVSILNRINSGEETVEDYYDLGINDVNDGNLEAVRKANQKKKGEKGSNLSKKDIDEVVIEISKVSDVLNKVNDGTATIEDLKNIGINNVNDDNIDEINKELAGKDIKDVKEIQDIVDAVNKNMGINTILKKVKKGTATCEDYLVIKVTGVTESNIIFVNNELKGKDYTSREEVQKAVDENAKLTESFERVNKGEALVLDYSFLGIDEVTDKNLSKVNDLVVGKDFVDKVSLRKFINENIDDINEEVNLEEVLGKIKAGTADVEDYASIKVSGVTTGNIIFVNNELKDRDYSSREEVQEAVDENSKLNKALEKVNEGEALVSDYEFLEITKVTEKNLGRVNDLVKGKAFIDKVKLREYIDNNINGINEKINLEEVLGKVEEGTAKEEDYASINVTGVTEENLSFVNDELKNNEYKSAADVQNKINENSKLNEAISRIETGEGTLQDYKTIGIDKVTEVNLNYVNNDIKSKKCTDLSSLKNELIKIIEVNDRYIKINNGEGTLDDFAFLNIIGVTSENLDYINSKVKNNVDINKKNLQSVVTEAINSQQNSNTDKPSNNNPWFDFEIVIRDFWGNIIKIIRKVIKHIFNIFGW